MISHPVFRVHVKSQFGEDRYQASSLAGPIAGELPVTFFGDPAMILDRDIIVRSDSRYPGDSNLFITNEPNEFQWAQSSSVLFTGLYTGKDIPTLEEISKTYYPGNLTGVLFVTAEDNRLSCYEISSLGISRYRDPNIEGDRTLDMSLARYWYKFPGNNRKYQESARVILFSSSLNEQAFKANPDIPKEIKTALHHTELRVHGSHKRYNIRMQPQL